MDRLPALPTMFMHALVLVAAAAVTQAVPVELQLGTGATVTGTWDVRTLTLETDMGDLEIPVEKIERVDLVGEKHTVLAGGLSHTGKLKVTSVVVTTDVGVLTVPLTKIAAIRFPRAVKPASVASPPPAAAPAPAPVEKPASSSTPELGPGPGTYQSPVKTEPVEATDRGEPGKSFVGTLVGNGLSRGVVDVVGLVLFLGLVAGVAVPTFGLGVVLFAPVFAVLWVVAHVVVPIVSSLFGWLGGTLAGKKRIPLLPAVLSAVASSVIIAVPFLLFIPLGLITFDIIYNVGSEIFTVLNTPLIASGNGSSYERRYVLGQVQFLQSGPLILSMMLGCYGVMGLGLLSHPVAGIVGALVQALFSLKAGRGLTEEEGRFNLDTVSVPDPELPPSKDLEEDEEDEDETEAPIKTKPAPRRQTQSEPPPVQEPTPAY